MPYACYLTVTRINKTSHSAYHNVLTHSGVQSSGQVGLDGAIWTEERRNLMNFYVTKIDDVVRDGIFFFFLSQEERGREACSTCPAHGFLNIDSAEVNINTTGSLGCL